MVFIGMAEVAALPSTSIAMAGLPGCTTSARGRSPTAELATQENRLCVEGHRQEGLGINTISKTHLGSGKYAAAASGCRALHDPETVLLIPVRWQTAAEGAISILSLRFTHRKAEW